MVKADIKGEINAKKLHGRVVFAALKSAEELAKELVVINEKNIDAGRAPVGAQKQNSPAWAAKKNGKPPLYDRGILKDARQWRVRVKAEKGQTWIDPPNYPGVGAAYGITKAAGYKSIATDLPGGQTAYEQHAQPIVDRYIEAVKVEE